jgi:hypothetical protein
MGIINQEKKRQRNKMEEMRRRDSKSQRIEEKIKRVREEE